MPGEWKINNDGFVYNRYSFSNQEKYIEVFEKNNLKKIEDLDNQINKINITVYDLEEL
ncbi:hypothetical protein BMW23_0887 [Bodo saltans virus]|jgi:hypothetical protein|uniref:Uncharacterized protein n=1 Tax=Bodo saltans virus TaxID=2024608 RepID=A0A2H4UVI6_9VIRU|nr:hypothetical protein QJ851_gp0869 [Bodo saltans virus]ATZ80932.1 hypothetical protein BMW23_0887 [Bodo saltans virus]